MSRIDKMAEVKLILDNMSKPGFGHKSKKQNTEIPQISIKIEEIATSDLDQLTSKPEKRRIVRKKGKSIVFRIDI